MIDLDEKFDDTNWKSGYLRGLAWAVIMADHLPQCSASNWANGDASFRAGYQAACTDFIHATFLKKNQLNSEQRTRTPNNERDDKSTE